MPIHALSYYCPLDYCQACTSLSPPLTMAYFSLQAHFTYMPFVIQIGLATLMIAGPPPALEFFLEVVSSFGVPKSKRWWPVPALKLSAAPWLSPLLTYIGSTCSLTTSMFPYAHLPHSGVTMLVLWLLPPIRCFMLALSILKWITTSFGKRSSIKICLCSSLPLVISVLIFFTKGLFAPRFTVLREKLLVTSCPISLRGAVKEINPPHDSTESAGGTAAHLPYIYIYIYIYISTTTHQTAKSNPLSQ
jgi:hypothetical protein